MYGYGLLWFIVIIAVALLWAATIFYRYRTAVAEARAVFDARQDEDKRFSRLGYDRFRTVYMRAEGPRSAIYGAAASLSALIAMPAAYLASEWIFNSLWNVSGREVTMDFGLAPWLFFMTLLMIGFWVAIAAVYARLYHHNKPGSLDKEMDKELHGA